MQLQSLSKMRVNPQPRGVLRCNRNWDSLESGRQFRICRSNQRTSIRELRLHYLGFVVIGLSDLNARCFFRGKFEKHCLELLSNDLWVQRTTTTTTSRPGTGGTVWFMIRVDSRKKAMVGNENWVILSLAWRGLVWTWEEWILKQICHLLARKERLCGKTFN